MTVNLTCDELRELIADHLGGELATEKTESFQFHVKGCKDCGYYVESYTHTVKVVRKLPRCGPLPANVEAKLREALKEHLAK